MKKAQRTGSERAGFTLIELLVVIAIIGVLAGMIFPALAGARLRASKTKALIEMKQIETAIMAYEGEYHRMPSSADVLKQAGDGAEDYTYGTWHREGNATIPLTKAGKKGGVPLPAVPESNAGYKVSNSELLFILRDVTEWPDSQGNMAATVNADHKLNPKRSGFMDLTPVSATTRPGVGPDGVYRDPWGNPYIVSVDLNGDERTRDAFYGLQAVSQKTGRMGHNGLSQADDGIPNSFELPRTVMVWSLGPDGNANPNVKATDGVNKDNILSWQ